MVADTILLRDKFSKASRSYDDVSLIQKEIAAELLARINLPEAKYSILDIGIGTGYLSQGLSRTSLSLRLFGVDLAIGMLQRCRDTISATRLTQSDAKHLPFKDGAFDLVVSNLAFQWVGDLPRALQEARRVLKDQGKFYFTIFSSNTFEELREVIFSLPNNGLKQDQLRPIGSMPDKLSLQNILESLGFKDIKIDVRTKRQFYENLWELLSWLKMIGANRYWVDNLYGGLSARNFIKNISRQYEERFKDNGKIFATFEVIFVELVK